FTYAFLQQYQHFRTVVKVFDPFGIDSLNRFSCDVEPVLEEFPEALRTAVTLGALLLCTAEASDSYIRLWIALDMILKTEVHHFCLESKCVIVHIMVPTTAAYDKYKL
ncbi:hypothetical protein STEG23_032297, partial [Scotinomys teguina]